MLPFIIVLVVLAIAMLAITGPLRRARTPAGDMGDDDAGPPATVAELEAAREAKYAEIREAELDHEMGKLSDEDFEAVGQGPARRGDRDSRGPRCGYHPSAMTTILDIVQVGLCVVLIFLILMHSGKDAGLSGAFGVGTGAGPFGGGSLVERNLNRWTVGFAIAFVINTIILIKIS